MMEGMPDTGWHRASMERFYGIGLGELLARRFGATGYACVPSDGLSVDVSFGMESSRGPFPVTFRDLPLPDADGVFVLGSRRIVVVPLAESEDLETGRILCAGEQALEYLSERVGSGPASTDWDEELVRSLAPVDRLVVGFLESTGQELDATNAYSRLTHLRRLLNPDGCGTLPASHCGRVCPVDMPENPERIGKVLTVSRGAGIVDGKIVIRSSVPVDCLGPVAAMIPFIHHTDPMRAQIGAVMMRRWRAAAQPEPALVRTGFEPEDPAAWLGCNLLTAFTTHGKDTYEDSLLLSRSAAARLGFDGLTAIGALLSNRNGQKGVVGKVLPDGQMPRLRDGTPVEITVSFLGLHTRMNTGQLLEAAASWIAVASDRPFQAAPFTEGDLDRIGSGLSGTPWLQWLRMDGPHEAETESLCGRVYWGVCAHHASNRLKAVGSLGETRYQRQGEMETEALIRRGAFLTIRERFTTLASEDTKDPGFSVLYGGLKRKLAAAGIRARMGRDGLTFRPAEPEGDVIALACPLAHPWFPGHTIRSVGRLPDVDGFPELEKANRWILENRDLPPSLRESRVQRLQSLLDACFQGLLTDMDLRLGNRVLRSGRGMICVGTDLTVDQAGIPRRLAEVLFGGEAPEWILVNRAPTMEATAIVAFHPVTVEGDAIRINPYVCRWLNADYDGDQVAVLVPGSAETQAEAGRLLSVTGHVRADPATLDTLAPNQEALWGLARLWLTADGRREVMAELPDLRGKDNLLDRNGLRDGLQRVLRREGAEAAVRRVVALWDLGFREAGRSGATLDPFGLARLPFPAAPSDGNREAGELHAESCIQSIATRRDYGDRAFGAQLLAVHSGARGEEGQILALAADAGFLPGMDLPAYAAHAAADHGRMARNASLWTATRRVAEGRHVLARAMRSRHPGIVFAHAAATGETDPLTDLDARLFVGLLPEG